MGTGTPGPQVSIQELAEELGSVALQCRKQKRQRVAHESKQHTTLSVTTQ